MVAPALDTQGYLLFSLLWKKLPQNSVDSYFIEML